MVVFGSASAEPFPSREIYMVDGDTAKVAGHNYRLVGYDTPETWRPKCEYERALGQAATALRSWPACGLVLKRFHVLLRPISLPRPAVEREFVRKFDSVFRGFALIS